MKVEYTIISECPLCGERYNFSQREDYKCECPNCIGVFLEPSKRMMVATTPYEDDSDVEYLPNKLLYNDDEKEFEIEKINFLEKNHFSYEEYWNLDNSIANFIIPRLEGYMKNNTGNPSIINKEEWKEILHKILYAMNEIRNDDFVFNKLNEERIDEGCKLLGKWFRNLWD